MNSYTLFTPGPIDVPDDILKETAQPLVYHREEKFSALLEEVEQGLKKILSCTGRVFFFASSGTGAMEAACSNILSSGDEPIVAICGRFGQRWLELCEAYHIKPHVIQEPYGRSIQPEKIEELLRKLKKPTVVFTTLAETSTGALNDIQAFGTIVHTYGAYLVVDGVAGIGADPCPQDEWHVDIVVGASQKALMAPPGMSFISVSNRAFEKVKKSDLPKYYFKLDIYEKFRAQHQTPWTPAITIFYGLKKGINGMLRMGLEKNFEHHKETAQYVRNRVTDMGMKLLPDNPSQALTVFYTPQGMNSTPIIKEVKEKHGILFANGQADLKGKIIRIGHMGNYSIKKLTKALDALETVINKQRT